MKKITRRVLALLLAAALILSLASCGKKEKKEEESASPSPEVVSEAPATPTPTPEPVYVTENIGTVHNVSSFLRIRSGPGTSNAVIGEAHSGDKFTVLELNVDGGPWHKISYNGGEGFVHGDYLSVEQIQVEVTD